MKLGDFKITPLSLKRQKKFIKFNDNKLNSLKYISLHKIVEFHRVVQRLFEHNLKISYHRHI
jgi:hypothetical protein